MPQLVIALPLPDAHLSPNGRASHFAKARHVRKARQDALEAAQVAIYLSGISISQFPLKCVKSRERYFWRQARRRDVRNAEASLKAYYDGLVEAGVLVDDDIEHLTHEASEFSVDREDPRVEIVLEWE